MSEKRTAVGLMLSSDLADNLLASYGGLTAAITEVGV